METRDNNMTIFEWFHKSNHPAVLSQVAGLRQCCSLAELKPGQPARVTGFSARLDPDRKVHLQAYGVVPGRLVKVSQHSPVTVMQVEHTELALERDMARQIEVERVGDF